MPHGKENPLIAGLLNAFVPGFAKYYVDKNLKGFITTLAVCIILIFLAMTLSNAIQDIKGYSIAAGLCPAGLLLVILVPLFLQGMKLAKEHNGNMDNTARFNESRQKSKMDKIERMRTEGLISKEEYDQKKDKVGEEKKAG